MFVYRSLAAATALLLAQTTATLAISKLPSLREQAQAVCYNDVMALCNDAVPDEAKVTVCMKQNRSRLSPECGRVFDKGMKKK